MTANRRGHGAEGGGRAAARRPAPPGSSPARSHTPAATRRSLLGRRTTRLLGVAAAGLLVLGVATTSQAATKITVTNPGGLTAVGPVNTDYGFPAWYGDSAGTRLELCLDGDNPLCGFLPGDIPNPDVPVSFPDNFPGEAFYQLVASSLTLPNGGKANLTLGLEASFANGDPIAGDQLTFARTRVTVVGGPRDTTLTFKHPFGELTIDTDATGKGRLVQDVSPAAGNFTTAFKGNFGPFVKWDPAVAPAAPAGYLGDPGQDHAIVGGKDGVNTFSVTGGGLNVSNDQFGISGKLATNTGVTGDRAVINGGFLDVFASSKGDQLQVDGVAGQYAPTPMSNDLPSENHYARIALVGDAKPTSVTVRNLADKPVSTSVIKLADVNVTEADYDGSKLTVAATGASYPLTVAGFGQLADDKPTTFPTKVPPATVSVRSANGAAVTYPVTVTGGSAFDPALPPVTPAPDPGPVNDNTANNPVTGVPVVSVAAVAPTLPGASVTLDASATTGATSYAWTPVNVPAGTTITGATTAKPTVTLPYFTTTTAATTAPSAAWAPITYHLTATNSGGTTEQDVVIPAKKDEFTISAGARHRLGTELRVDGTSLIDGQAGARTPPTGVVVWNTTGTTPVKLGTANVDTLGAWTLRLKPGPSVRVSSVLVQSTRGGSGTTTLTQ